MPTFREFLKVAELTVTDKTSGKRSREIMGILRTYQVTKGMDPQKAVAILEALGPDVRKDRADRLEPQRHPAQRVLRRLSQAAGPCATHAVRDGL